MKFITIGIFLNDNLFQNLIIKFINIQLIFLNNFM